MSSFPASPAPGGFAVADFELGHQEKINDGESFLVMENEQRSSAWRLGEKVSMRNAK
jgi:hypothetical protein